MADEEDPYAVSSDSEDEGSRKPPPKIQIEGRANADINQLVSFTILLFLPEKVIFCSLVTKTRTSRGSCQCYA